MPLYEVGEHRVRRKNSFMPCALGPRFDAADAAEQVRLLKETAWADLITEAEWKVVLGHDDATAPNRSRLKRKAAGWLMALARIAVLEPELFEQTARQARDWYADQVGEEYPWSLARHLAGLHDEWDRVELRTFCNDDETDDDQKETS
jgi:hypothetical protein